MSTQKLQAGVKKMGRYEIALWIFGTNELMNKNYNLANLLSNEEKKRSQKYYFENDSKRYVCAHGILRLILGEYTNIEPRALSFKYVKNGKPELKNTDKLKFNLSHTKELIAIAITRNKEIGVDIEKCTPLEDVDDMSINIMHEDELSEYLELPENMRNKYFYQCWVKKESIVKAWGVGLYENLQRIKVTKKMSTLTADSEVNEKFQRNKEWNISEFTTKKEHLGAICYEGPPADKIMKFEMF